MLDIIIVKIGGSTLRDGHSYATAAEEIGRKYEPGKVIVVLSAMKGVTNNLLNALEGSKSALKKVEEKYLEAATYLGGSRVINKLAYELSRLKCTLRANRSPAVRDIILSYGERLSKLLLVEALTQIGVKSTELDARKIIVTTANHGSAEIMYRETFLRLKNYVPPLLEEGIVPVVEGFVGSTLEGETTTLGRGGSDYTATTIAALLKASNVHIITDVPGIMTADPKYVKNARIIPKMNYREALEASIYGCRNMHPRTFHPLVEAQKCRVRIGTWETGTIISHTDLKSYEKPKPKLVTYKQRSKHTHLALIGEGAGNHKILATAIESLALASVKYKGIYSLNNRPSLVVLLDNSQVAKALKALHKLVIGGETS